MLPQCQKTMVTERIEPNSSCRDFLELAEFIKSLFDLGKTQLTFTNRNQKAETSSTYLSVDGCSYCCPCSHGCHVRIFEEEMNYSSIHNVKNQEHNSQYVSLPNVRIISTNEIQHWSEKGKYVWENESSPLPLDLTCKGLFTSSENEKIDEPAKKIKAKTARNKENCRSNLRFCSV